MPQSLNLYNTLTHNIDTVVPVDKNLVRLYTCGPTVYNSVHIGNLRSFIMADLLYRTLINDGYEVDYVMNITDVDDKTIKGAIQKFGNQAKVEDLRNYTTDYLEAFLSDLNKVQINPENIHIIRVSDVMPQIKEFITQLLDKGYAYHTDDGVYFSIEKYQKDFKDYGSLVGEKFLEGKQIGARVAVDEYDKDNLSDFALWKTHTEEDGQIFWDHEVLGKGRPGWHIECSVINQVGFSGKATDIHTGGVDLIFPHHTNEIAQSQPFGPFVNYWMHAQHLMVQDDKMAKSKKNFYTLEDIETQGFSGSDLRYLFLQSHYKTQANFSFEALEAAKAGRQKLQSAYADANTTAETKKAIIELLNDDLSSAEVIALAHQQKSELNFFNSVLGLGLSHELKTELPEEVNKLVQLREIARANKDFAKADKLRDQLLSFGYEVSDTSDGQKISKA